MLLLLCPFPVAAWPFGPGRCTSGTPVREPHVSDPTGELADAGYEILINGLPLTKLSTTDMSIDVPYTWELRRKEGGQESSFRGFLVHFTETTRQADLSDILSIGDDSEGLAKVLTDAAGWSSCGRNNVAAGHLNNWEKQSVGGELIFDEVGEIDLEISVVAANKGNANRWYYTKYFLKIKSTPETEDFIPSPNPTKVNMTQYDPTIEPSLFQTAEPTLERFNLLSPIPSFTENASNQFPMNSHSPFVMKSNHPSNFPSHLQPSFEYSTFTEVPSRVNENGSASIPETASFMNKLCLIFLALVLLLRL